MPSLEATRPSDLPRFVSGALGGQAPVHRPLHQSVVLAGVHELEHMLGPELHTHPALQHGRLRDALPLHVGLRIHASGRDGDHTIHVREVAVMGLNS